MYAYKNRAQDGGHFPVGLRFEKTKLFCPECFRGGRKSFLTLHLGEFLCSSENCRGRFYFSELVHALSDALSESMKKNDEAEPFRKEEDMNLEIEIPLNDDPVKHCGWTVQYDFIEKISQKAGEDYPFGEVYSPGMEETESVILALLDMSHENKNT